MMLVHIAYPISTIEISHQNSSLLLLPSLDWRFDYFYYRQRNRRSILIRHPSSRLIRLHYPCCALCTILLARYPGAVPFNLSILPLTFLFYFIFYCLLFAYGWSRRHKKWQTVLLRMGRHLAFFYFLLMYIRARPSLLGRRTRCLARERFRRGCREKGREGEIPRIPRLQD